MTTDEVVEVEDVDSWESSVEKSKTPALVMFYSPTCPHCQMMEPYFNEYAKEFKGTVSFIRVNVATNIIVAAKYGVMGTPTFKFFCNGHPVIGRVGEMYPTLIKKIVEEGLQEGPSCSTKTSWINVGITGYT